MAGGNQYPNDVIPSFVIIDRIKSYQIKKTAGDSVGANYIIFCKYGVPKLIFNNMRYVFNTGCLYLIDTSKSDLILCDAADKAEIYLLQINNHLMLGSLVNSVKEIGLIRFEADEDKANLMGVLAEQIYMEYQNRDRYGFEITNSLARAIIYTMLRIISRSSPFMNDSPNLPEKIKKYIDENYTSNISLNSIANEFYISADYLSHIFKNRFDISPINYIINLRIVRAQILLINTNETVNKISELVGYDNAAYFSTLFRKMVGSSPASFRLASKRNI